MESHHETPVSGYVHRPLRNPSSELRLFRILPGSADDILHLAISSHEDVIGSKAAELQYPGYTALSYTWEPQTPLQTILMNNSPFVVGANIHAFLRQLQSAQCYGPFWADAICITQGDVNERNQQVARMATIFARATGIAAWIGQETQETASIFQIITQSTYRGTLGPQAYLRTPDLVEDDHHPGNMPLDHVKALATVLQREYWSRTWIVQEIRVPNDAIVLWCGSHSIPLASVKMFHLAAMKRQLLPIDGARFESAAWYDMWAVLADFATRLLDKSHSSTLRTLISHHRNTRCSDLRDKIYAIRGLATDVNETQLIPQYSRDSQLLFWDVLCHMCGNHTTELTELGYNPLWKLLHRTLGLSISEIQMYVQSRWQQWPELSGKTHFSLLLKWPSEVTEVEKINDSTETPLEDPDEHPHNKLSVVTTKDHFTGITYSDVRPGDFLLHLRTSCELYIVLRRSHDDGPLRYVGWAVASIRFGNVSWCQIAAHSFIYPYCSGHDSASWLTAKLSVALSQLQQASDSLVDGIRITKQYSNHPHAVAVVSLSALMLLLLWEYADHPARSSSRSSSQM